MIPSRSRKRRAAFETFEQRLVMAGLPIGDFYLESLDSPPLQHFANPTTQLADVHSTTGVSQVRGTYGLRGTGQTVAVIDSGIAWDHYALGRGYGADYRVVGGWDFTEENDANPYDDGPAGFHGTHVAGIIGSDDPRNSGVAPGVDLVALRVFNDQGAGYFEWVEKALQWVHQNRNAFENPITTVNLSLRTEWNANWVPGWSRLEDEFAQLKADGIFISVAAGNAFQQYLGAGLSYPAASPYVVPVSSVTNAGLFSSFSQRHARVLAAPGQSITSTVPDHVYGVDGVANDYGTASGTSMAAPYVAGAAVLVREAMQFVGLHNITQDTIYDHLRSTADIFYDAATHANYHRINVQRAIDVLLGNDDYGSTIDTGYALGSIDNRSVSGSINKLQDVDVFTFRADVSGTVTLRMETSGALAAQWTLYGASASMNDGVATFHVEAGKTYSFSISTSAGIGHYTFTTELESAVQTIDWGTIEHQWVRDQNAAASHQQYQITAGRTGLVSILAAYNAQAGNVQFEVYRHDGRLVASSHTDQGTQRADFTAVAGESFLVRVSGSNRDVDFCLSNLVAQNGNVLTVFGTSGADTLEYTASTSTIVINGMQHRFGANAPREVRFELGAGQDQVTINQDAGGYTSAELRAGRSSITRGQNTVTVLDAENVVIHLANGSGQVTFFDTAGNDRFVAAPQSSEMTGNGYRHRAVGFSSINARATSGYDVAEFYGSAAADTFTGRATSGLLERAGYRAEATSFDQVTVSGGGGQDIAWLYGSAGTDRLTIRPDTASFSGDEFAYAIQNFAEVHATAGQGGDDRAAIYDSAGNDRFVGSHARSTLRGGNYVADAMGFGRVDVFANAGGTDVAELSDSAGNDHYTASPGSASLEGSGYRLTATGFYQVIARSTAGGRDIALLNDSRGDDTLLAYSTHSVLSGQGFVSEAHGFSRVNVNATTGYDRAELFDSSGDDRYYSRPQYAYLQGIGFYNYARGFDVTIGSSLLGGNDIAYLYDSAGNDLLRVRPDEVTLEAGTISTARRFERTYSYATAGQDEARFWDSAGDDRFVALPGTSTLSGPGYYHYAQGFQSVFAYATAGGRDEAILYDSFGNDRFLSYATGAQMIGSGYQLTAASFENITAYSRAGQDRAEFFELVGSEQMTRFGNDVLVHRGVVLERAYDFAEYLAIEASSSAAAKLQALDEVFRALSQNG